MISKNLNYSIKLTEEGITIKHEFYSWPDILETYFVRRGEKKDYFFLLLGLRNGELVRFDLKNFVGPFSKKIDNLIRAIEFYKYEAMKQSFSHS